MQLARWGVQLGHKDLRICRRSWRRLRDLPEQYRQVQRYTSSIPWVSNTPNDTNGSNTLNTRNITERLFQSQSPTIYALSSGSGRAAIAVVRCSGDLCIDIYQALCPGVAALQPRRAAVRTLFSPTYDGHDADIIDPQALLFYYPGPNTATGEDVLEMHIHGGPAVVKALLRAIPQAVPHISAFRPRLRYAEPGEFTRRAFYNGRLDLTQVEALGDILSAETEQQRRIAVSGIGNTLNERYEKWRTQLLYARGELEALIDFSEDQHFDESAEDFVQSITSQVRTLVAQVEKTTANAAKGELLRNGIQIALLGAPNAGKSSLLNRITSREAAIVSAEPGTTRDVIEVNVDVGGFFCRFKDLAGIRSSGNGSSIGSIEQEGIIRAKAHAKQADIVIVLFPVVRDAESAQVAVAFDADILDFVKNELSEGETRVIFVLSKSDLAGKATGGLAKSASSYLQNSLGIQDDMTTISCIDETSTESSSEGVKYLLDRLATELTHLTAAEQIEEGSRNAMDASLGTTQRQETLLAQCAAALEKFLEETNPGNTDEIDVVLAAERLRVAADCLAKITGRGQSGDVEEVLGVVFEKFCVGK